MLYVGIDWARKNHQVALVNSSGKLLESFSAPHSGQGFQLIRERIEHYQQDPSSVRVAIELHDGPLCNWLPDQGYQVLGVNPKSAAQARTLLRPSGCKDDVFDAYTLATVAALPAFPLQPLPPSDDTLLALQTLLDLREDLVEQKTTLLKQIRTLLDEWAPALSALCKDLNSRWQRQLLHRWPLERDLADAHPNAIASFAKKHRLRVATRELIRGARSQMPLPIGADHADALRRKMAHLLTRLDSLCGELQDLEAEIDQRSAEDENAALVDSLPAVGIVSRAAWTVALRCARVHGLDWEALAARCGVAPLTRQSGGSRSVHRRRGHDRTLRRLLTYYAFITTNCEGCWAHDDYQRRRARGASHYTALRAIARRWLKIACALVRHHDPYSEQLRRQAQSNDLKQAA